jgi:PAS domain-containing protein
MAAARTANRPMLRIVEPTTDGSAEWIWFCGHCAAQPSAGTPAPIARVCAACGFGLLLEARSDAAPTSDDAFLVIDSSLSVQAMSRRAEFLLGVREDQVVNCHVSELLTPADSEGAEPVGLAVAITSAARGDEDARRTFVRPSNTFGVRMEARIATCGPPRAALLVLR